jgi:primosomal protein N' (replication factor Y)
LLIRVAVPVPQLDLLTYRVPEGAPRPTVGARVVVPLGSRVVTGIVVDADATTVLSDAALKPIRQLLDTEAFIPADVVELAKWTSEYYAAGLGEALLAVLPPKTRGQRAEAHKTQRVASITPQGLETVAAAYEGARPVTPKQRQVLALLAAAPNGLPTAALAAVGCHADIVARLVGRGLLSLRQERL